MPQKQIDVLKMFKEVFESEEPIPELDLGTLDAYNHLEFNKRRNYSLEHNERHNKEEINKKEREKNG